MKTINKCMPRKEYDRDWEKIVKKIVLVYKTAICFKSAGSKQRGDDRIPDLSFLKHNRYDSAALLHKKVILKTPHPQTCHHSKGRRYETIA